MAQDLTVGLGSLEAAEGSRSVRIRKGRGTGSGFGKTSGRGGKGQTARRGKGRPRGFEGGQMPLYRRLPKFGFKNAFRKDYEVVNIATLEERFETGSTVDLASLVKAGLISNERKLVKILGEGNLSKKLTVRAHKFSKSAVRKINQAGGQADEIELKPQDKPKEDTSGG